MQPMSTRKGLPWGFGWASGYVHDGGRDCSSSAGVHGGVCVTRRRI